LATVMRCARTRIFLRECVDSLRYTRRPMERPTTPSPSMGGITRMHDPSELAHDRVRRRAMHIAFAINLVAVAFDLYTFGISVRRAAFIVAWMFASIPLAIFPRLVELRFKMSGAELRLVLKEIPIAVRLLFAAFLVLWVACVFFHQLTPHIPIVSNRAAVSGISIAWALFGVWLADFFTYFRYRHERLRHIYAVAATLEDLRGFKKESLCPLIALALQSLAFWLMS
jgi:hypothetical protein